jgi:hypothetical protein
MADFTAHRINVGTDSLPQFQVYITMSNCGVMDGLRVAITNCATVEELEEEVNRLIKSLRTVQDHATGILEENDGML